MRQALTWLALCCAVLLAACGGGGSPPGGGSAPAPIVVSVSPVSVQVQLGSQRQFTATVQGGGSGGPGGVTWSVVGSGNGTIDSGGLYSAPVSMPPSPNVTIVATSVADPTVSATATAQLTVAPVYGAFPVRFDVRSQNGWQAASAPVTVGVPLPPALHADVNQLRLQTQSQTAVPAQFRVMSRWPDNSIRWVLVDFLADLSGTGGVGQYQLNNGGTGSAPAGSLQVINGASSIEVRTGVLNWTVSKTAFRLFESILVDRDNDGQVDDQCLDTAQARGLVITEGVNQFRMDQIAPTRIVVEEQGPIRATVVVEGVHRNTSLAQDKLNFIVRITSWANLPLVKVAYSFRNMTGHGAAAATPSAAAAQLAQATVADAIEFDLPLLLNTGTAGALVGGHPATHAAQALTGAEFMDLQQGYTGTHDATDPNNPQPPGFNVGTGDGSSDPLQNVWPDQGDAQIAYGLAGKLSASGQRAPGWMQMTGLNLRATAVVRDFWQMYPKQLRMQGNGLMRAGLWPAGTWPLQVFAGSMRTHEMLLGFDRVGSTDANLAGVYANILNDAPLAVMAPKHNAAARVFGQIGVTNDTLSSVTDVIGAGQAAMTTHLSELNSHYGDILFDRSDGNGTSTGHEYGFWNWGDGKTHLPAAGWENNDWEISRCALNWYACSGNIGMWKLFDSTARHFRDVDVLHSDIGLRFDYTEAGNPAVSGGKASQQGKTRYSPNNKQHDLGNYHFGDNHLDVFKGAFLAEHYLLTGDQLSLDVLKEVFTYLRGTWKRFFDAANGGVDSTMTCPTTWLSHALFVATAYEVANGSADTAASPMRLYVLNALRDRQDTTSPRDPAGNGFDDSSGNFKAWQVGHVAEALEYARGNLNDAGLDGNIERCMNWLLGTNAAVYMGNLTPPQFGRFYESPGGTTDYGGPNLMIGAGYVGAWRASGNANWQTAAQTLLVAQNQNIQATTIGDAAIRHSSFAQFFRAGPYLLGCLRP